MLTKNGTESAFQCSAWWRLIGIHGTVYVESCLCTKLWSPTSYISWSSCQSSEQWLVNAHQESRCFCRLGWWWSLAVVLWNLWGIVLIDYLEKGKTMTETYFAVLLDCFKNEVKEKLVRLACETDGLSPWRGDILQIYCRIGKILRIGLRIDSSLILFPEFGNVRPHSVRKL